MAANCWAPINPIVSSVTAAHGDDVSLVSSSSRLRAGVVAVRIVRDDPQAQPDSLQRTARLTAIPVATSPAVSPAISAPRNCR